MTTKSPVSDVTTKSNDSVKTTSGGSLKGRRICIIGAGIGGLTAALAFARRGADVQVFEQAAELTEAGAGIQVAPNGARVLEALGLADGMAASSIVAQAVVPTDAISGKAIAQFDLSTQMPPYRFFHRSSLVGVIGRGAQAAGAKIYFGVRVLSVAKDGTLNTSEGAFPCDLCIGADGIHAVSRLLMTGAPEAQFTGQVAWRATITVRNATPRARIWMAPDRHVVSYPLRDDTLNIVAVQERPEWAEEGWSREDDPANLRAAFADVCPELREILGHVRETYLWGLFRHPVAKRWFNERIVILGDAAHPTLPFLAQGANLAIEDAYVLARCCDENVDFDDALTRYQAERVGRVNRAIAAANANARNYHLSGVKRRVAHMGLKTLGIVAPNVFMNRLGWLYDHDVTK